jgi:hypothetical protein
MPRGGVEWGWGIGSSVLPLHGASVAVAADEDAYRSRGDLRRRRIGDDDPQPEVILSFLLYWQVLDIPAPAQQRPNAKEWVDAEWKANRIYLRDEQREILDRHRKRRSLGEYFEDDCRNAIAHLQRYPGRKSLLFDDLDDLERMRVSSDLARDLARRYVEKQLGLSKRMSLYRKGGRGFPIYFTDGVLPHGQHYVLADS